MFHEMRKNNRALSYKKSIEILKECQYGVLSSVDGDLQPYGVPLNYVVLDKDIFFHCADAGHKLHNIAVNHKVSFCVVRSCTVVPERFTTLFESAVVFGNARLVHGYEKRKGLQGLIQKYCIDHLRSGEDYIDRLSDKTAVVKIHIDHITGKGNIIETFDNHN
ncbi:MAG: pyridoxamine 5'-phosphate oxidase family protein [Desulfamplus sp.]|nr:pyridoxamine 5'-phosphate oxidase family protein [Desulfamplus sp.]